MRLIDADAIKLPKGFFESVDNVPKFYEWLNSQPTIDPVRHGKWIKLGAAKYRCGECGKVQYGDRGSDLHFCCNCGTKNMDGWEYV